MEKEKEMEKEVIAKEYLILFNQITRAINQLENLKNELIDAQIESELQFIEAQTVESDT